MSSKPYSALDPCLEDLKQIIDSRQLDTESGKVTCIPISVNDDTALQITDTQNGEMIVTAEMIERVDFFLALPLTPAISKQDPNFAAFEAYLVRLCSDEKVILARWEEHEQVRFAVGIRFSWTRNRTELARLLEHNLAILNRFYVKHSDDIMKKLTDWEF